MVVPGDTDREGCAHDAFVNFGSRIVNNASIGVSVVAQDTRDPSCYPTPSPSSSSGTPQSTLCLAALRIYLLNEQSHRLTASKRLESSLNLSAASLRTCRLCRETASFQLRVDDRTPRGVWEPRGETPGSSTNRREPPPGARLRALHARPSDSRASKTRRTAPPCSKRSAMATTGRVPSMKISKVSWETSSPAELFFTPDNAGALHWLIEVRFGESVSVSVDGIVWPANLRRLAIKPSFEIRDMAWPVRLEQLALEGRFDQPINGVEWPESLQELTFGYHFNHPIDDIGEKAIGLRELTLGWNFDQSLVGVTLPKSLKVLTIAGVYNRPLDGVKLPSGLRSLTFGGLFDLPLVSARLPEQLESLRLGWAFNQPLLSSWPPNLKTLALGYRFNQPVESVRLPPSLKEFELGVFSRQPLKGLAWPASLKTLTVGRAFDLTGVVLPGGARVCRRGHTAYQVQRGAKR
ncbi:unnamed protein product [Ectocarpus sp. 12 AP-2014]